MGVIVIVVVVVVEDTGQVEEDVMTFQFLATVYSISDKRSGNACAGNRD
jgi:hypothetical protein